MDEKLLKIYKELKAGSLTPEEEQKILQELYAVDSHGLAKDTIPKSDSGIEGVPFGIDGIYDYHDLSRLQGIPRPISTMTYLRSLDELLEQDKQREKDGFPKKIRVGRMVKPGRGGKDKVVVVPTTVEEKFIHDRVKSQSEESESTGGTGAGEKGEVVGEVPVRAPEQKGGAGPGQGEGSPHEMESSAYDLGKILTEKFELPNLKEKGKKRSLTRYTYDLTDKHRGFGQLLDKKATLRKIVETNIHLGNLPDPGDIDPRILQIRRRLEITEDLSDLNNMNSELYDPALKKDILYFQERHGLEADGVIGKASFAAMNVPVDIKINQIRLNLERFRWVTHNLSDNFIIVNIARFRAYVVKNSERVFDTNVQVGTDLNKTPVFKSRLQYIEFNPTWTVPSAPSRVIRLMSESLFSSLR